MINWVDKGKKARKRFVTESVIIFFIIITPFIFKIHEYLPHEPEETIHFLGLEIGSNGFVDVSTHIWFLFGKIIPLYLLTIWFFTCKHWWYHILLIPICMYAFQLFEVVYSKDVFVDTENILWLLPVCMVVITFVYFVRVKLYDKYVHGIDLEAMDVELQYYRDKENDELRKHGITPPSEYAKNDSQPEQETDLSEKMPQSVLSKLVNQLKHGFQSLL